MIIYVNQDDGSGKDVMSKYDDCSKVQNILD
jgi:hypothetical protein